MAIFENVKDNFSGKEDDIEIRLPKECGIKEDKNLNIDNYTVTLSRYEI